MRRRPRLLLVMALIFLGIVISFPVQVALLYGHGLSEIPQIVAKISLLNYLVALTLVGNIPLILRASQWLWVSLPFTLVLVGWNNWVVATAGQDFSPLVTWLATLTFSLLGGFMFVPSVWSLMREPKRRWWLQAQRKEVSLPITLKPVRGNPIAARTFDLSRTGAFIPLDESFKGTGAVVAGDIVVINFSLGSLSRISCNARVVRRTEASGHYPEGLGLQFLELKRGHERILRDYMESLPETHGRGVDLTM